ncbi:MAG: two component transcriptional regulator, Fis family [Polyangiaceae bacterium]|jgi:two-component system response regulator RegA|nr:two component transcriptional regulator, Fis family [Polyangiaceae bacterium]
MHWRREGRDMGEQLAQCAEPAACEHQAISRTVLLADPTRSGETLADELVKAGCRVHRATAFAEAVTLAEKHQPDIALIELGWDLSSGLNLLIEIERSSPATRCIVVTMYGSIESARAALERGAVDYLTKPINARQVLFALENGSRTDRGAEPTTWVSVEMMRQRYIQEVFAHCGSLASTARALCVERRSLRRMMKRLSVSSDTLTAPAQLRSEKKSFEQQFLDNGSPDETCLDEDSPDGDPVEDIGWSPNATASSGAAAPAETIAESAVLRRSGRRAPFGDDVVTTEAPRNIGEREIRVERLAVVAHPTGSYRQQLARELSSQGYAVQQCERLKLLKNYIKRDGPELVVIDLRLHDGPTLGFIQWLRNAYPETLVVVVTEHGSVASAVRCMRLGVHGYHSERVSGERLLQNRSSPKQSAEFQRERPLRLERAVWEYLNRVVNYAGSIAEAAKLLELDRRSLRRMLSKYAPPQ